MSSLKQSKARELAFQRIRKQTKVRYGNAALRKTIRECNCIERFFGLLRQCVYDPVYVRRWFLFGLGRQKRCNREKGFVLGLRNNSSKTKVKGLQNLAFSDWFIGSVEKHTVAGGSEKLWKQVRSHPLVKGRV